MIQPIGSTFTLTETIQTMSMSIMHDIGAHHSYSHTNQSLEIGGMRDQELINALLVNDIFMQILAYRCMCRHLPIYHIYHRHLSWLPCVSVQK